ASKWLLRETAFTKSGQTNWQSFPWRAFRHTRPKIDTRRRSRTDGKSPAPLQKSSDHQHERLLDMDSATREVGDGGFPSTVTNQLSILAFTRRAFSHGLSKLFRLFSESFPLRSDKLRLNPPEL